jgi:uncharacterized damage-inducible protein DinB
MKNTIKDNLNQLSTLLQSISEEDYSKQTEVLSGSTIGQHFRHIIEFYLVLVDSKNNTINYDNRKRNTKIENSTELALKSIKQIETKLEKLNEEETIFLEADFTEDGSRKSKIKSSMAREMAYCLEHSIHHQALIKAGLVSLNIKNLVNDKFGVAYSTLQFKNKICAQ